MTEKNEVKKKSRGRKSEYREEYAEQALKLCLLGATDKEIAEFFSVSEQTLNSWKKKFPQFLESLKRERLWRMRMSLRDFTAVRLATMPRLRSSLPMRAGLRIK